MSEQWKDIKGREGFYQVSNHGRVRSLDRTIINSKGVKYNYKGKILKQSVNTGGYCLVDMSENSIGVKVSVHRLVASAFINRPETNLTVNHIDGNKKNNNSNNLEWCTLSENIKHAFKTGLRESRRGSDSNKAKLTEKQVVEIRRVAKFRGYHYDPKQLAIHYDVYHSTIQKIVRRETWKHI